MLGSKVSESKTACIVKCSAAPYTQKKHGRQITPRPSQHRFLQATQLRHHRGPRAARSRARKLVEAVTSRARGGRSTTRPRATLHRRGLVRVERRVVAARDRDHRRGPGGRRTGHAATGAHNAARGCEPQCPGLLIPPPLTGCLPRRRRQSPSSSPSSHRSDSRRRSRAPRRRRVQNSARRSARRRHKPSRRLRASEEADAAGTGRCPRRRRPRR